MYLEKELSYSLLLLLYVYEVINYVILMYICYSSIDLQKITGIKSFSLRRVIQTVLMVLILCAIIPDAITFGAYKTDFVVNVKTYQLVLIDLKHHRNEKNI